jgi:4a-hydroxytetrahydrobiopterin dehydratase
MVGFHPIGKIEPSLNNAVTNLTTKPYLREIDPPRLICRRRQDSGLGRNREYFIMAVLTPKQIKAGFNTITNWSQWSKTIGRTYNFDGFVNSLAFVNHIARNAQQISHYPKINIEFDQVTLTLTTHGEGGITEKDFALARQCDEVFLKSFSS